MDKTLRQRLIEAGIVKESEYHYRPNQRPFLNEHALRRMKDRLIRSGFLKQALKRGYH